MKSPGAVSLVPFSACSVALAQKEPLAPTPKFDIKAGTPVESRPDEPHLKNVRLLKRMMQQHCGRPLDRINKADFLGLCGDCNCAFGDFVTQGFSVIGDIQSKAGAAQPRRGI